MRQFVCREKKSRQLDGAKVICNWRESGLRATLLSWSPLQMRFLEPSAPREVFAIKCIAKSHDGRAEKPIFNPIFG